MGYSPSIFLGYSPSIFLDNIHGKCPLGGTPADGIMFVWGGTAMATRTMGGTETLRH